jgi:hypothetical protein
MLMLISELWTVCLLHRLTEGVQSCKIDWIPTDTNEH